MKIQRCFKLPSAEISVVERPRRAQLMEIYLELPGMQSRFRAEAGENNERNGGVTI